jgi:flagellar motor switch/type III secretory pathway protein FliN
MPQLGPQNADQILDACRRGAAEAAGALSAALDQEISVEVKQARPFDPTAQSSDLHGPGLAIVLHVADAGMLLLIGESTGLLPRWCANPDAEGRRKLATLAQQIGGQLLPDEFAPSAADAGHLPDLAAAALRGELADDAQAILLHLTTAGKQGILRLIWPVSRAAAVLGDTTATGDGWKETVAPTGSAAESKFYDGPPPGWASRSRLLDGSDDPQTYGRSLLRIKVPVSVTLASARKPIGQIVRLGPGAILQFDKSCEEMLQLNVGNQVVAEGEAVKVGDKFGLRILSLVYPEERFRSIGGGNQRKRPA